MSIHTAFALTPAQNNAGALDVSFAAAGKTQVYFEASLSSMANGVAVDACGRLLVAAKVGTAGGIRFGLARLLDDGSADLSFGHNGSVVSQFEQGYEAMAGQVRVLPDGNLLVAGLHYENAHRTLPALALFDPQGKPVQAFGDNGRCVVRLPGDLSSGVRDAWLAPGVHGAESCACCVQEDGRILLLANHHFDRSDHAGLLIRLERDGTLDESFNGRGFVVVRHLLMNSTLNALQVQEDGKILVGGSINFPEEGLLARYHADGRLDECFALDGFMGFTAQGRGAQVSQIVQHENGDLQCFGSSRHPVQCMTLKIHRNGRPDIHCHGGLPKLMEIGHTGCQWTAAQRLENGCILTVGTTLGGVEADFILARHLPDGQLDYGFGNGHGWVRTRLGRSLDSATAVAVQADGKVVVGGYSLDGNYRAVVVRYLG